MTNFTYDALVNDNVRFLQGTQSDLNKYLPSSADAKKGKALEGAFYLTTDTHKLYVGRKVTEVPSPNPYSVAVNDVYPEEVSAGLNVVNSTADLTAAVQNNLVHDGDIYYVTNGNILAVYETGEAANGTVTAGWVQINAPAGIDSLTNSASKNNGVVDIETKITTQATGAAREKYDSFGLKEGDNVTLTVTNGNSDPVIEIAATDTTYFAGTEASKVDATAGTTATNGAYVGLKKDNANAAALDSNVIIKGANGVGVVSDANGNVTVQGINFANKGVAISPVTYDETNERGYGFQAELEYTPGDGSANVSVVHATKSEIDPLVTVGSGTTINGTSFNRETVHFINGTATLGVYTQAETDAKILETVNERLAAANAMTYMGTIKDNTAANADVTATAVINTIATSGTGHNGDTYKAACDFAYGSISAKKGDLIILRGAEVNGAIPAANLSIDVIPAGDEPNVVANFVVDNNGAAATEIELTDGNKTTNNTIGAVTLNGSSKILVKSAFEAGTSKHIDVTVEHAPLTVTPVTDATLTTATASGSIATATTVTTDGKDSIGPSAVQLYVLNSSSSIGLDGYGHVNSITGKAISFRHNRLRDFQMGYSAGTLSSTDTAAGLISKADANMTLYDSYTNIGSGVSFESSTLSIGPNTNDPTEATALAVDIKWG